MLSQASGVFSLLTYKLNVEILFQDPAGAHPSFINFKAATMNAANDASGLAPIPTFRKWDGWVMDINGNLVIWVPDEYRHFLLWRGMIMFLGHEPLTVDFTLAVHGTEWTKCYEPLTSP